MITVLDKNVFFLVSFFEIRRSIDHLGEEFLKKNSLAFKVLKIVLRVKHSFTFIKKSLIHFLNNGFLWDSLRHKINQLLYRLRCSFKDLSKLNRITGCSTFKDSTFELETIFLLKKTTDFIVDRQQNSEFCFIFPTRSQRTGSQGQGSIVSSLNSLQLPNFFFQ